MRLSSQGSQFIFNLPSDFFTEEILNKYNPLLEKNWVQYTNIVDYLNSTIKEMVFPGLSIQSPIQRVKRGKEINYKPATNVNDIASSRELDITFRSVDSHLNYMILHDMFIKHYLDTGSLFVNPFILQVLDIHRDVIYEVHFKEIILKSLSEMRFLYNDQAISETGFTLTFSFNFYETIFNMDRVKQLQLPNSDNNNTYPSIL